MAPEEMNDDVFVILSQIFGAFAHGADGLPVDGKVILQARADYLPIVTRRVKEWHELELGVLAAARLMGKLAGHFALGRDGHIIEEDYVRARGVIGKYLNLCPFRHPHR
jgi:hypothetical protein